MNFIFERTVSGLFNSKKTHSNESNSYIVTTTIDATKVKHVCIQVFRMNFCLLSHFVLQSIFCMNIHFEIGTFHVTHECLRFYFRFIPCNNIFGFWICEIWKIWNMDAIAHVILFFSFWCFGVVEF